MFDCELIKNCKVSKTNSKETIIDPKAKSNSTCFIVNKDKKQYDKIEFENCVFKDIQSEYKKCDFGLEIENEMFFIELKGCDNNGGLKQLLATIEKTKQCFTPKKLISILIVSQVQKPENLDKITFRRITQLTGTIPIIKKNSYTINI